MPSWLESELLMNRNAKLAIKSPMMIRDKTGFLITF
jgi:hypothetical protein